MRGGSKPGERRGGRKKGSPNKATAAKAAEVAASGITPLDFMLNTMRNEASPPDLRFEAAKAAAPYIHPKLSNVDHKVDLALKNVASLTDDELMTIANAGRR